MEVGPVRSGVLQGEAYSPPSSPWQPKPKGLPAGQGVELQGEPYLSADVIDVPFTSQSRPIPRLPDGNGEMRLALPPGQGFELVDRPAASTAAATKELGTLVEAPPQPTPQLVNDSFGAGTRAARERMKAREAAKARESENLVTYIQQMGGIKWTADYNPKILKQNPDLKRTLNNTTGQPPDAIASQLIADGWPIESSDHMMELLKSGKGRTIYNPNKQDMLLNREINRRENEYIKKQLAELEASGNYQSAGLRERIPDHQARAIDEIGAEGLLEERRIDQALNEVSDFFAEMSGQVKKETKNTSRKPPVIGELIPRK